MWRRFGSALALAGTLLFATYADAAIIGLYSHVRGRDEIRLSLNARGEPVLTIEYDSYPAIVECSTGYQSVRHLKDRASKLEFDENRFKGQMSMGLWYSEACLEALWRGQLSRRPYPTRKLVQQIHMYNELKASFTDAAFRSIVAQFKSGRLALGVTVQAMADCYDTSEFERTALLKEIAGQPKALVKRSEVVFAEAAECADN